MHKDFNDYNEIFILYAIYDLDLIILKELAVVQDHVRSCAICIFMYCTL